MQEYSRRRELCDKTYKNCEQNVWRLLLRGVYMKVIKEIIDYLREVWNIPLARDLILIIATAGITHFLESRKQKKEQKQKFKDVLGEQIAIALSNVRDIVVRTKTMEVYTEGDTIPTDEANDINAFRNFAWYPSFMNDKESLFEFYEQICSLRSKHEQFLDLKSAAYLYGLEKYLMSLALYINKNSLQDLLPLVGCFVIIDVQKWEKKFDIHLVKQMNKPHYKLFSRHGIRWSVAKWYIEKFFLEKSELHKVMQGTSDFPSNLVIASENKKELQKTAL